MRKNDLAEEGEGLTSLIEGRWRVGYLCGGDRSFFSLSGWSFMYAEACFYTGLVITGKFLYNVYKWVERFKCLVLLLLVLWL